MQDKLPIGRIGLFAAIFLIMSNMLGSGVFMLPATLAAIGGISLIGWLVAMVGVIALALVFAKLANIDPYGAGPYAYAKKAFGKFIGYQTNYVYSIASWVGNVSLVSVILGYLSHLFNIFNDPLYSVLMQIFIIWFFTLLNISGARIVGIFQSCTLFLALIPILFMATFGWHWFNLALFKSAWNVSHLSPMVAVNASFNNIMWAFIGIESACVSAHLIKNPKKNIPLATIGGVIVATLLYVATCTVIMGIVPNHVLIKSSAPFADAVFLISGGFASNLISVCAIINCLGALAGWTMVIGQTASAAAKDGLFPKFFTKVNKKGVPSLGLIWLAVVMTIVVIVTVSPTASEQFGKIITMSVILYLIPYVYSGFAIMVLGMKNMPKKTFFTYVVLGCLASCFCLWSIIGSDNLITVWAFIVMMSSTFFYAIGKTQEK